MRKLNRTLSIILVMAIMLSFTVIGVVSASDVEYEWRQIATATGAITTDNKTYHALPAGTNLTDGKYKIVWDMQLLTAGDLKGANIFLKGAGDEKVQILWKGDAGGALNFMSGETFSAAKIDNDQWTKKEYVRMTVELDLTAGSSKQATITLEDIIKEYDDSQTPANAVTKTVDCSALSAITALDWTLYEAKNLSQPYTESLTVYKEVAVGGEIETPEVVESEYEWKQVATATSATTTDNKNYHAFPAGTNLTDGKYKVVWDMKLLCAGDLEGANIYLKGAEGESVHIMWKDGRGGALNFLSGGAISAADIYNDQWTTAQYVRMTVELDLTAGSSKQATITLEDIIKKYDATATPAETVTKTFDCSAFSAITDIEWKLYNAKNLSQPYTQSFAVYKEVPVPPRVKSVEMKTGTDAIVILKGQGVEVPSVITPAISTLTINFGVEIDLTDIESKVILKTDDGDNVLADYYTDGAKLIAAVDSENGYLEGEKKYVLSIKNIESVKEQKMEENVEIAFTTGKQVAVASVSEIAMNEGVVEATYSVATPTTQKVAYAFVVSCYDADDNMLWCGYVSGESATGDINPEVTVPEAYRGEGTKIVAYLWDSPLPTMIYTDEAEI